MTLLPIVDRELRVASRRPATFWTRAGFGLGALAIGAFFYLGRAFTPQSTLPLWQLGNNLFLLLGCLSLLYCAFSGVRGTADALSEEKREGTLGLLFLTDLRGYDVVLGKMAATALHGFYGLLAVFPVLALTMLIGGVAYGDFWRMTLVLVNTFLFSQAAGIFISVLSVRPRQATAGTVAILLLFCAALPAAGGLVLLLAPGHRWLAQLLFLPSLVDALYWGCFHYRGGAGHFWSSIAVTQGLTWCFLLAASWLAPGCWQDKPAGARAGGGQAFLCGLRHGFGRGRSLFRRRLLEINAFYWLAARARIKPAQVWLFLGVVAPLWAWGCTACGSEWYNEGVYFTTAIILNSALKLWVASEAGRKLGEDRKSGALELILATSFTVKDILRGQWLALRRQFGRPLLMIIGVETIFMAASRQRESFHDNPLNVVVWIAGLVMLLADMAALGWVSMWVALTSRSPNRITSITVIRLLIAPWILYVVFMGVGATIQKTENWPQPTWKFFVGVWFALGMAFDLAFGLVARWQLRNRFRELVLARYSPRGLPGAAAFGSIGAWERLASKRSATVCLPSSLR